MSSRTDAQRLGDILDAIAAIRSYASLRDDPGAPTGMAEGAVKYRLVEIGEAVGDLSAPVRAMQPLIP